jgi:hypothetical protein
MIDLPLTVEGRCAKVSAHAAEMKDGMRHSRPRTRQSKVKLDLAHGRRGSTEDDVAETTKAIKGRARDDLHQTSASNSARRIGDRELQDAASFERNLIKTARHVRAHDPRAVCGRRSNRSGNTTTSC